MNSSSELPKVIDKSQADVEAVITAIKMSNLPVSTQEFAISCIHLAIWLPRALLQHKIKLSNFRKLIFGSGKKNKKKSKKDSKRSDDMDHKDKTAGSSDESTPKSKVVVADTPASTNQAVAPGHGRLSHSAYTNSIEHQLLISGIKAGDPCSMQCGGKFYSLSSGIIVRVTGQNLATAHKYWIQKLRCSLCGYLLSANVPAEVGN